MKVLSTHEIEYVAGGSAKGAGKAVGGAVSEMKEHPEAAFLGPVLGAIYLWTRH